MPVLYTVIIAAYFAAGLWSFFWIRHDAEFRTGPWVLMGILSVFLWPLTVLIWMLLRGDEHITSMAAKQSHRDYQAYMRTKKDKDLFVNLPKASDEPGDAREDGEAPSNDIEPAKPDTSPFHDYNIEKLMEEGKWDEALATAKSMRKVALSLQEEDRVTTYDNYIQRIEETHGAELE